ncbi:MAG: MFS transporter [Nitriliruptoraceae bacterium]
MGQGSAGTPDGASDEVPDIAPSVRGARLGLTGLFLASGLTLASFLSRIPSVQNDLGLPAATLGLVLPALSVGVVTGLLLAGRVIGRTGSRRLMLAGVLTAAVALPLTGLAAGPLTLASALLLLGLGAASMDVGMNAQGIAVERSYGRSILIGMHAAWSVGTLIGALAGSFAIASGIPVWAHLAMVAVLVAALGVLALRRLTVDDRVTATTPARFALPRGPLFPLALVAFASILGESTAGYWAGIHLRDTVAVAPGRIGWAFVAHTAGMVGARLIGDRLVGRFGRHAVIRASGLLAGAGFLVVATVPVLLGGVVGFLLAGLGLGSLVPLAFASAGRVVTTPGEGVAAVLAVGYLAFLIGPPVIGALADTIGLSAGFLLVAVVIALLAARPLPVSSPTTTP